MAGIQHRDRIVVFRLTQDEYKHLQRACTRTGARNISDYMRTQLLDGSSANGSAGRLEGRMIRFDKRISELKSEVQHVARLLKQMKDS